MPKRPAKLLAIYSLFLALVSLFITSCPWTSDYTITYMVEGKVYKTTTAKLGEQLERPADPGVDFDCWCTDPELQCRYSFSLPVSSDLVLYDRWKYLTFVGLDDKNSLRLISSSGSSSLPEVKLKYSNKVSVESPEWTDYTVDGTTGGTLNFSKGERIYFKYDSSGVVNPMSTKEKYRHFDLTGKVAASGNLLYLIAPLSEIEKGTITTIKAYCFYRLFSNCDALVSAPTIPSALYEKTSLDQMFLGCKNLRYVTVKFGIDSWHNVEDGWLDCGPTEGKVFRCPVEIGNSSFINNDKVPFGWTVESSD